MRRSRCLDMSVNIICLTQHLITKQKKAASVAEAPIASTTTLVPLAKMPPTAWSDGTMMMMMVRMMVSEEVDDPC